MDSPFMILALLKVAIEKVVSPGNFVFSQASVFEDDPL